MIPRPKTIYQFFAVLLALWAASAWADTLELRDGQTLTGQFTGGSREEVHFQVGSQTLRFPLAEVSRLTIGSVAQTDFQRAAKDALRQLKALASVTEGGTTYQNYSSRIEDAKIKIDQFLDEHRTSPLPEFNKRVAESLGLYVAASTVWNAKVARLAPQDYASIFQNPYVLNCAPVQEALRQGRSSQYSQRVSDSATLSIYGVSLLWECARHALVDAENALSR